MSEKSYPRANQILNINIMNVRDMICYNQVKIKSQFKKVTTKYLNER